jgi:cytosine/adenosine deaminase-related metal-dependent hydrolase
MRKISADYIFPVSSEPIKNGVVSISDDGTILALESSISGATEHYSGIICPGFINTHCHLELSHLRSQISEKTGITGFIKELIGKRTLFSEDSIRHCIAEAEKEMIKNGIVAVGDISNNNSSFDQKAKGNLLYHTFIEIFSMDPSKASETFEKGKELIEELSMLNAELPCSIVPHAPYTMSEELLLLINNYAGENESTISIHNQESQGENELFVSNTGVLFDTFKTMGINPVLMRQTGKNSLQSTLTQLNKAQKTVLVHNTFTSKEDLDWISSNRSNLKSQLYFCTCPNANLFIENKLPDYKLFIEENATITIGTDSLASNWSLSILDELKTIVKYCPQIPLQILLKWATKNGADCLGFNQLGTIEKDKKPGLNLLKHVNGMEITENTEVVKLA